MDLRLVFYIGLSSSCNHGLDLQSLESEKAFLFFLNHHLPSSYVSCILPSWFFFLFLLFLSSCYCSLAYKADHAFIQTRQCKKEQGLALLGSFGRRLFVALFYQCFASFILCFRPFAWSFDRLSNIGAYFLMSSDRARQGQGWIEGILPFTGNLIKCSAFFDSFVCHPWYILRPHVSLSWSF